MPTDASQPFDGSTQHSPAPNGASDPTTYLIELDAELAAAAEGWRKANKIKSTNEALTELVRLGLLSEISQLHDLVASIRNSIKR